MRIREVPRRVEEVMQGRLGDSPSFSFPPSFLPLDQDPSIISASQMAAFLLVEMGI
jgi:hypothetical protein